MSHDFPDMIPFPRVHSLPKSQNCGAWVTDLMEHVGLCFAPWDLVLNEKDGGGLDEVMAVGRGTAELQDLVPLTFHPLCQMPICPAVQWDTRSVDQTPLPIDH